MIFEYSAGAFIYRIDRGTLVFLLLKKDNGEYDVPKGHIEKGESAEVAAKREIAEESGITADFVPFFNITTKYFFRRDNALVGKGVKFFISEVHSPLVRISYEHVGYEWATYEEAMERFKFKDMKAVLKKVNSYITRYRKMAEINAEYAKLASGPGWRLSGRLVPGEGRLDARIMLVGQAPGADEDRLGRPFIGRSGRLLDAILRKTKIRRQDVYITSVVQFFPPKNRMPTPDEVEMCRPYLEEQIKLIRPTCIILLGNLASSTLVGMGKVETNHGKVITKEGTKYMVTFHPAAALRFRDKIGLMEDDMKGFVKGMRN